MLELRPNCECCDRDLPGDSGDALISARGTSAAIARRPAWAANARTAAANCWPGQGVRRMRWSVSRLQPARRQAAVVRSDAMLLRNPTLLLLFCGQALYWSCSLIGITLTSLVGVSWRR